MTIAVRAQIVTFRLGDDLFAADINEVERVLRYAEPTPVPNVPEWVRGVVEYRSRVVPVIDLRTRFELPARKADGATRLMVLSADGEWIAAVVDAVLEVVPITDAQLAPPPPLFGGLSAEFLRGILRRSDRLIIVLDVARLLSTKERLAFDRTRSIELAETAAPAPEPVAIVEISIPEVEPPRAPDAPPSAPGGDALVITRSGDPLLNDPLDIDRPTGAPLSSAPIIVSAQPSEPEAKPAPGSADDADGGFGRADG